jgi:hypothetical protein
MDGLTGSPGDGARSTLPPWLRPGLIASLARIVEREKGRGACRAGIASRTRDAALALCPALPRPHVAEAVAVALWVGGAEDADG